MRISLSLGEYATTPYFIPGIEIPVYCVEELCVCMKENAFFLDNGIMNDQLVEWISFKCGLKELAQLLDDKLHGQCSLSGFVACIMDFVGLYNDTEKKEIEDILKKGAGRSSFEKRKERVDFLVAKKKYAAAIRGYENLLERIHEESGNEGEFGASRMTAALIHNEGVAYVGLMQYDQAAKLFLRAFELTGEPGEQVAYLAAKRMYLSESEYVAFVSGQPDSYSGTLQLEKVMEGVRRDWEKQADYQRLAVRKQMRSGSDKQKYYDENERLTQALKENYRDCAELV